MRWALWLLVAVAIGACTTDGALPEQSPETTEPSASTSTTIANPPTTARSTTSTTLLEAPEPYPGAATGACRPDPFAGSAPGDLGRRYPGRDLTAHIYDIGTGCEYSLNPENRQSTASVFKVLVMAGTLLEAQQSDRDINESEMARLMPMITESANWPVRALWRSFGGSPWFRETGATFALSETSITADGGSAWGATRTSAADQVHLLRQVLLGDWGPLDEDSRQLAFELMTSVVADQTWGITAGVPKSWTVAQKNGFAGKIINSVGWVDPPGPEEGYLIAILTYGWPSHAAGISAVEFISALAAAAMIDTVPGAR
ncbi:MAG TPA: serine hydrolase [Acidimicrobiia bacterium]|nr:serine hydrolase [Acidimicrobiia bacterium]